MTDSPKPAGWYHAAGDPPGSHRYWDGERWQGEPRVFGGAAGGAAGVEETAGQGSGLFADQAPGTTVADNPVPGSAYDATQSAAPMAEPARPTPPMSASMPGAARSMEGGFLSSLFDLSFTTFITTKAIKVIYVLWMVIVGLTTLIFVGSALTRGAVGLLSLLVIIPLALFYLIFMRMTLEFLVNQFRQTELLEKMAGGDRR